MENRKKTDFQSKCAEIFEKSNPIVITDEGWEKLSELFGAQISDEYKWILNQYGGVYVKEGMLFRSAEITPLALADDMEHVSFFFGMDGPDNLFQIYDMYAAQIPVGLIPIGSIDGGNLLCMQKNEGRIYIWIHDRSARQIYLAGESLNDFFMSFQMSHSQLDKKELGVIGVKCSDSFLRALKGDSFCRKDRRRNDETTAGSFG